MFFPIIPPPETLPQHFERLIDLIRNVIADHIRQNPITAAFLGYVYARMLLMRARFTKLADRAASGQAACTRRPRATPAAPPAEVNATPEAATPAEPVPTTAAAPREPRTPPAFLLPRAKGWLRRMVPSHHLGGCASQFAALCDKPDMAALLDTSPEAVRICRRLYRMLTGDPFPPRLRRSHESAVPDSIRRPPPPTSSDGIRLPTRAQFQRAERRGKPYRNIVEAWGRIMSYGDYMREREYRLAIGKID